MEQALGSTDPPDKSERNSRQMCFGDKEDPMEKNALQSLEKENRIRTERELWYIIFYGSWHIYCSFFTKLFVLSVFMANTFYRQPYFYFIYRYFQSAAEVYLLVMSLGISLLTAVSGCKTDDDGTELLMTSLVPARSVQSGIWSAF